MRHIPLSQGKCKLLYNKETSDHIEFIMQIEESLENEKRSSKGTYLSVS